MDKTSGLLGQPEGMDNVANERDTQKGKYMTFKSGSEYFGLEIQYVQQIIQFQAVTKIPETEDYIKGLINLRGKIVPVVDVRLRFHQGEYEYNDKTCILVINVKDTTVGLIVEQIAEVAEIQKENILPIAESAAAWGISYKIEKAEYTESFGDRNLEHLENYLSEARTDSQGNLSGDFKYLFLTITFTNTTDEFREINRNAGGISVIGASLNTLDWSNDVVYYDLYWEEGGPQDFHHWGLEPGESVTSEVGWVIEGCGRMTGADDTLAERMGAVGSYELYYHVKQFDSDNEGSFFIDLGVKVE